MWGCWEGGSEGREYRLICTVVQQKPTQNTIVKQLSSNLKICIYKYIYTHAYICVYIWQKLVSLMYKELLEFNNKETKETKVENGQKS